MAIMFAQTQLLEVGEGEPELLNGGVQYYAQGQSGDSQLHQAEEVVQIIENYP